MWCFRISKKESYKAMVNNLVLAEESNQALLAEVKKLKEERSDLVKAQEEETCRLKEQVTQLQTEKSALEKDFLESTAFNQHQLDTTLQEKTSLEIPLQQSTAELQSMQQTLDKEKQDFSTELQSVQQTLRTLEERAEEDRQRKDSIIKDADYYIKELETKMQDQEMHLKKEMDAQEAEKQKLKEQVTQLQTEKSALEKDCLESTTYIEHQLKATLQVKTSLQLSLQKTSAELQTTKNEVRDLKEACARCEQRNKQVTDFSKILKEENKGLSEALESVKQTLKEEKQASSTELQSIKTTLRTSEKRYEEDGRRRDSIMKDAGLYIDELKTEMQDQEMQLRNGNYELEEKTAQMEEFRENFVLNNFVIAEMEERTSKFREIMKEAVDENLHLKYQLHSTQKNQDPQEGLAPHHPQQMRTRSRPKTDVYKRVTYGPKNKY